MLINIHCMIDGMALIAHLRYWCECCVGTTEKIFRVPVKNETHELHAGWMVDNLNFIHSLTSIFKPPVLMGHFVSRRTRLLATQPLTRVIEVIAWFPTQTSFHQFLHPFTKQPSFKTLTDWPHWVFLPQGYEDGRIFFLFLSEQGYLTPKLPNERSGHL